MLENIMFEIRPLPSLSFLFLSPWFPSCVWVTHAQAVATIGPGKVCATIFGTGQVGGFIRKDERRLHFIFKTLWWEWMRWQAWLWLFDPRIKFEQTSVVVGRNKTFHGFCVQLSSALGILWYSWMECKASWSSISELLGESGWCMPKHVYHPCPTNKTGCETESLQHQVWHHHFKHINTHLQNGSTATHKAMSSNITTNQPAVMFVHQSLCAKTSYFEWNYQTCLQAPNFLLHLACQHHSKIISRNLTMRRTHRHQTMCSSTSAHQTAVTFLHLHSLQFILGHQFHHKTDTVAFHFHHTQYRPRQHLVARLNTITTTHIYTSSMLW